MKNIPIYTSREDYIGKGTIGGYVDMSSEHGKALGKMVLKIYKEKGITSVPLINKLNANYIVDYDQIYNYNVKISNIPKETIINKKTYELLLSKEKRIVVFIAFIALFIAIIYIY